MGAPEEACGGCRCCKALGARIAALEQLVAALQQQLGQHSRNSHRPPSSDPPSAPARKAKKPTGRKPGGQPGHERHVRPLVPVDQVADRQVVRPDRCDGCGGRLRGSDPDPLRHQVTDLPPVEPVVVEYQLHALTCRCGTTTRAALPPGVPTGAFGPRVQAMAGLCSGAYHLSKRAIEAIFADCFGLDLALGTVSKLEQATSQALAAPVAEAHAAVQAADVINADETSWRQARQKAWLWVAATTTLAVFLIRRYRNAASAKALLGRAFGGLLGSDRWSSYRWMPLRRRQLCWAHLKRDFQKMVDAGGEAARVGRALLRCEHQLFAWWHRIRDGTLRRSSFRTYVSQKLRRRMGRLLRRGARCDHGKTAGMCREILVEEEALWTFVRVPGVEPTNNAAERALRPAVLWRKSSFGTHSAAGSVFVERMLTTVTSLRLQGRHVLDYLTAACEAALQGRPAPSLLPAARRVARSA